MNSNTKDTCKSKELACAAKCKKQSVTCETNYRAVIDPFFKIQLRYKWDKVFKNGPNKICGRQPVKNLKGHALLKQTISFQIFKGCLPQI